MDEQKNKNNFRFIWSLVMVVAYIGLSYILVFTPIFETINSTLRLCMAILFTAYGIFRAYRLWIHGK